MKTLLRHDEYVKKLLENRSKEERKVHPIHETGERFSSPPGATTLEENRILTEYMEQINLQNITKAVPNRKKPLLLRKFFKMKRNQQVIVYIEGNESPEIKTGRVQSIGRDFVMLNNLSNRIWIPYQAIVSANIPTGVPTYSNSHHYFIYDNNLKNKLLNEFGKTVSKRDALIQQFFEETLMTNLRTWQGIWVKVVTTKGSYTGKIDKTTKKHLILRYEEKEVPWGEIQYINTLHFYQNWFLSSWKKLKRFFSIFS